MQKTITAFAAIFILCCMGGVIYMIIGVNEQSKETQEVIPVDEIKSPSQDLVMSLEKEMRLEIGEADSVDPAAIIEKFPGLKLSDFDEVQTPDGYYSYAEDSGLQHQATESTVTPRSGISEEGYETLAENVVRRVSGSGDVDQSVESVVSYIKDAESAVEPSKSECTAEAKICPDGTAVSRSGPNCEFAPCPEVEAKICPDGTAVSRSGPNCEFAPCPEVEDPEPKGCTMEAKICPDGTAVSRSGPNCEFAPCPEVEDPEPKGCTMEAKICPDGTAVSRSGPNCEFAPCPQAQESINYGQDAGRVEEYKIDCEEKGGVFNECASACGPGAEMCATVCSMVCMFPSVN
jgi:hypothetical protein